MSLREVTSKKETIFIIEQEEINDRILDVIISKGCNKKIGINMKNVTHISSCNFVNYLIENKFKLFNLKNEILIYLSLIIKNGFLKSFMSYNDFSENKRELIKRNFVLH